METKRIHNLTEQEHSIQRTCFMVGGQECSKRPLTITRDVAVPPKKRKQLHEELDLCDISTDQNPQKSEGINIDFSPESENENLHKSTPSTSQTADEECQIEFNLQSSMYFKADDSAEWNRLKCFESIVLDGIDGSNSATFFAGGPIQSSAFSIMPPDMRVNQYIAIASSNVICNNLSYNDAKNMNGIIQLWNLGSLHESKTLNQRPSMELALCHDNGIITQMKWCPADCYDKYPSTCHLPRLGLLAVSCSDSCVYIYNVPQPHFMPKLNPTFPVYFTQPSMKLVPLFGGPSYATRKSLATCIEWEENGERIVAGYGNGTVCVWMLKISSFASNIAVKSADQSYIVEPYLCFEPFENCAPVLSLSFAPFSNNRFLAVLSMDKCLRVVDLFDTTASFQLLKTGIGNCVIWEEAFCGFFCSPSVNSLGFIALSAKDYCEESKKTDNQKEKCLLFDLSHVAISRNKNIHAIGNVAGTVTVNFLQKIHKPLETSYLTYMLLETEIVALDSVDLDVKTSESKISIQGNFLRTEITPVSDMKSTLCAKMKQGSSSSSSSSGFCSPKRGKTIVIETDHCFGDDAVNFQKSPSGSSVMNGFKDNNNNRIKEFLNKQLNSDEEGNDEKIKCCELSEDLMRDLLMVKISNLSKSSSHILPFNSSNNSAYCDSKGAKSLSDGSVITSPAASDFTGDTIMYPLVPCFCDTSHSSAMKYIEPNAWSENLGLNEKGNNDLVICDRDDQRLSERALNQFSTASNYSGDTVIYSLESYDFNKIDRNYLKREKPGAISQSLSKSETENTFQNNILYKMNEDEAVLCGSKTKLLTENSSYFTKGTCEHFLTKESLKSFTEYDSATQTYYSSDEDKHFYQKDCLISDFSLLQTEYLFDKSEDKQTSNELPKSDKNLQDLSYENLISRYGVILKNNMDVSSEPLESQEIDIYYNNPLSVIKTISWNPNEGCQSWMLLGGNSGICHLAYVPDFAADIKGMRQSQQRKKPQPVQRNRRQTKRVS